MHLRLQGSVERLGGLAGRFGGMYGVGRCRLGCLSGYFRCLVGSLGGATSALQTMNSMFEMCNMPIVTSQYWNIAYGREKGEVSRDLEGMQTMRTMARNMAWILKKFHGIATIPAPDRESPWQPMHFIR